MRSDREPVLTGGGPPPDGRARDWVVAIPLKRLRRAKSRILVPPRVRESLALAMALDTATAALGSPLVADVLVLCGNDAAPAFAGTGCRIVPDDGTGDLNDVLAGARQLAVAGAPTSGFASLVADLPAMRPHDLTGALSHAGRHARSFVPDVAGAGTTLLAALPGAAYTPAYGEASAHRHRGGGATPLPIPGDSPLRHDIDTLADLRAVAADVGPRTAGLLEALLGPADASGRRLAPADGADLGCYVSRIPTRPPQPFP